MVIMLISDYVPINMCTDRCRAIRESGTSARTQRKKSSWAVFRQNNTKENKVSGQWDSLFFLDQQAFVRAAFLPAPCEQKAFAGCCRTLTDRGEIRSAMATPMLRSAVAGLALRRSASLRLPARPASAASFSSNTAASRVRPKILAACMYHLAFALALSRRRRW